MKNIIQHTAIILLSATLFSSCTKDVLRGEGSVITETRSLPAFSAIEISGNRNAEIVQSTESKVEMTGYQNLVPAYKSYVSYGKLRFEYSNYCNVSNDNIRLKIYTPMLSNVSLSGNSDMVIGQGFSGNYLEAFLSGNGELRINGGQYDRVKYNTSGSAKILAAALAANTGDVSVSGNGHIEVGVTQSLNIRISGNGEVYYWGNPVVTSNVSGNGKIVKR